MDDISTDICIIGAGSAGVGAAVTAARTGASVMLVEAEGSPGGTSVHGGVHCWEPGVGGPGLHTELYGRIAEIPGAAGIGSSAAYSSPGRPFGFSRIDPSLAYDATLRRSGVSPHAWRRVHFEPSAMAGAMDAMLIEAGVRCLYRTNCIGAERRGDRITAVIVYSRDHEKEFRISARVFIDAGADIPLARFSGCGTLFGRDPGDAPHTLSLNGVTLIMRVSPARGTSAVPAAWMRGREYRRWYEEKRAAGMPGCAINEYPNGDLNLNVLPVMDGAEYFSLDPAERMRHLAARAFSYWQWMHAKAGFEQYRFVSFAPAAGVRESHRLNGRYMLSADDVLAGFRSQQRREEIIAFADHALDIHGEGHRCTELSVPYGVPFASLLPREAENLIVACRGASFSRDAASSCRLSRTMIAIGEAAGAAAAIASADGIAAAEVPVQRVRTALGIPAFEDHIDRWHGV